MSRYVDHGLVLPHASVFVGHAGHGGIMAALRCALPVVSIPMGNDQPHNARRLEASGAGVTLDRGADVPTVADAVDAVLRNREMRDRARGLASAIDQHRHRPVRHVEALLV